MISGLQDWKSETRAALAQERRRLFKEEYSNYWYSVSTEFLAFHGIFGLASTITLFLVWKLSFPDQIWLAPCVVLYAVTKILGFHLAEKEKVIWLGNFPISAGNPLLNLDPISLIYSCIQEHRARRYVWNLINNKTPVVALPSTQLKKIFKGTSMEVSDELLMVKAYSFWAGIKFKDLKEQLKQKIETVQNTLYSLTELQENYRQHPLIQNLEDRLKKQKLELSDWLDRVQKEERSIEATLSKQERDLKGVSDFLTALQAVEVMEETDDFLAKLRTEFPNSCSLLTSLTNNLRVLSSELTPATIGPGDLSELVGSLQSK